MGVGVSPAALGCPVALPLAAQLRPLRGCGNLPKYEQLFNFDRRGETRGERDKRGKGQGRGGTIGEFRGNCGEFGLLARGRVSGRLIWGGLQGFVAVFGKL